MAKLIPNTFDMFSEEGNAAVRQMLITALDAATTRDRLCTLIWNGIEEISKTHEEVFDTSVRECILGTVAAVTDFTVDELYPKIMFGK